uniref:LAGLIDADG endonuclease n=1 Tax=Saccharomycopsis fibuligera TaxID=4944 RepID=UPI002A81FDF4|nr:LAGLIDADG endonuclease [Saccharomycopsis fibuligera]WPA89472.1 LAGLIDADG endonuclease [Saccharomycopsis fibuligera]
MKNILGVGIMKMRKRKSIKGLNLEFATFCIRNKKHLKEVVTPIFDQYPMTTLKQYDYTRFKENLLNDIMFYDDLMPYKRSNIPLYNMKDMLNKEYFSAWLMGFIEAEGSFGTYEVSKDNYQMAYF